MLIRSKKKKKEWKKSISASVISLFWRWPDDLQVSAGTKLVVWIVNVYLHSVKDLWAKNQGESQNKVIKKEENACKYSQKSPLSKSCHKMPQHSYMYRECFILNIYFMQPVYSPLPLPLTKYTCNYVYSFIQKRWKGM